MNKQEYLNLIQNKIDELEAHFERIPKEDSIEKALTLGKINSFLIAKLHAFDLEEDKR